MRLPTLGAVAAAFLATALALAWIVSANWDRDPDWRTRDLQFLKAAYDRIQAELAQHAGSDAEASLRRGQEALVHSMLATAKPMPPERIPADIKPLLAAAATPRPEQLDALFAAVSVERSPDFATGLDLSQSAGLDLADLAVPPELRAPLPRPVRRKPPADKPPADKPPAKSEAKPPGPEPARE